MTVLYRVTMKFNDGIECSSTFDNIYEAIAWTKFPTVKSFEIVQVIELDLTQFVDNIEKMK